MSEALTGCAGFKWPRIASNGKFCCHDDEIAGYVKVKTKKKSCFLRHAGHQGEMKYSSYSFLTSALEGGQCQCHAPAAL